MSGPIATASHAPVARRLVPLLALLAAIVPHLLPALRAVFPFGPVAKRPPLRAASCLMRHSPKGKRLQSCRFARRQISFSGDMKTGSAEGKHSFFTYDRGPAP